MTSQPESTETELEASTDAALAVPSPSGAFVFVSLVVIVLSLWIGATLLGNGVIEPETSNRVYLYAWACFVLLLGFGQCLATFARSRVAVIVVLVLFAFLTIAESVWLLTFIAEWFEHRDLVIRFSLGFSVFIFLTLGIGLLEVAWLRKLVDAWGWGSPGRTVSRFTILQGIGFVALCGVVWAIAACHARTKFYRYEIDVSRDQAPIELPTDATHVTYEIKSNWFVGCDFDTTEDTFVAWFAEGLPPAAHPPEEIQLQPIERELRAIEYGGNLNRWTRNSGPPISDGLHADWRVGDIRYEVTFDRENQHAYYQRWGRH
ncbi:hypothetical protein [Blastopirellula marina]|uniref:Uncharacterized protein n=1 Tax=Blastopirellula marina TaxID=124 RepID=A0A2S8GLA1_9BACT|nr:hypothetical protein [Blastopirellula marina]PQO45215.1 hypothetical protein C5Y93_14725 [Blastopirellula marina]